VDYIENAARPEDFPIGSLESRAAARAMLARKTQDNDYRFRVQYMGFDEVEYVVNDWTRAHDGGVSSSPGCALRP
jgi:hypothetical protein